MVRMPSTIKSASRRARTAGRPPIGWILAVFTASVAMVVCVFLALAWFVGGRMVPTSPTVQELLPPEPRQSPNVSSPEDVTAVSALQPPVGAQDEYVVGEAAAILPGARKSTEIKELPVGRLDDLKPMGWAVPYLSRGEFDHEYVETSSLDGVRTIQVRLADGQDFINVAETRPESDDVQLYPLQEKLHSVVNLDEVSAQEMELTTGHEGTLYSAEDADVWTSAVETSNVQYVITSSLPAASASEVTSWVLITDRSRVQLLPSSPGPADRIERGFEEMRSWFEPQ